MGAEQGKHATRACPACKAEIASQVKRCPACGQRVGGKRRRGVAAESDTPFSPGHTASNRSALFAYRLAVISVVPGVGLVLGPIAVLLALRARRRGRRDANFTAFGPAGASIILGLLTAATNWVGCVLMFRGLRATGWF